MNADLQNGRNGLHFAADYNQIEIIEYLLSKGANINVSIKGINRLFKYFGILSGPKP